jgi:hypothetical protein
MKKITDVELCCCVLLKYAFATGETELISSILRSLVNQMGMDYDTISETLWGIQLTGDNTSFIFTGSLDEFVKKMLTEKKIHIN